MQLQLVVADLHVDRDALDGGGADALPRLPGLECVLRFGQQAAGAGHWRDFVAEQAGRADLVGQAPAPVVAVAAGLQGASCAWFATPVHLVAGLDHLRLHPSGLLRLAAEEQQALAAEFNGAFGGEGLCLHPVVAGFVLTGLEASDAETQDPVRFLGADVRAAPPRGPDAPRLRRLGAEIEMWLHARAAVPGAGRRGLAVNGLWLWGGGRLPPASPGLRRDTPPPLQASAEDAFVAAVWRLGGRSVSAVPARFQALTDPADEPSGAARLICLSALAAGPGDRPLARLEADWFAPAVAALRDGRLQRLALQAGGRQLLLARRDLWRRWRRARPWWEWLAS